MQKINFQNLPNTTTPVNATNLNDLQDNVEDAIEEKSTYSTNETRIGTWVNGKPIYRQVFVRNNANNFNGVAPYNDEIIKMQCLVKRSGQNSWRNFPWLYSSDSGYGSSSWAGGFYYQNGEVIIQGQAGSNITGVDKLILIIEYTKTTD